MSSNVFNASFFFEKLVFSMRSEQDKEVAKANILNICKSPFLASPPRPFRTIDSITFDQLGINGTRIFSQRNAAGHIKPIASCNVSNRKLLYKTRHRHCFTSVFAPRVQSATHSVARKRVENCLRHNSQKP